MPGQGVIDRDTKEPRGVDLLKWCGKEVAKKRRQIHSPCRVNEHGLCFLNVETQVIVTQPFGGKVECIRTHSTISTCHTRISSIEDAMWMDESTIQLENDCNDLRTMTTMTTQGLVYLAPSGTSEGLLPLHYTSMSIVQD